jgi:peptidoglycan/xylan/chitin deacetylase (PgdA/CDA1 family)
MTSVLAPGHAVDTFPEIMRRVVDAGHEVGYHGYYHENPTKISRETEKKLIQLGLNAFRNQLGVRPLGTALRIWEYSEPTLDLVEEFSFKYDSSLMGRDLQAYHPQRWQINWEKGNVAGWASRLLEIPVCWYIDDFPVLAFCRLPGWWDRVLATRKGPPGVMSDHAGFLSRRQRTRQRDGR